MSTISASSQAADASDLAVRWSVNGAAAHSRMSCQAVVFLLLTFFAFLPVARWVGEDLESKTPVTRPAPAHRGVSRCFSSDDSE